jgi:hypothetical protein
MVRANLHLTDYEAAGRPVPDDLNRHCSVLSTVLTDELEGAAAAMGMTSEAIVLAALGRAFQRTIGEGYVAVDVARQDASYPVELACVRPEQMPAAELVANVHHSLAMLSAQRKARPIRQVQDPGTPRTSDVFFAYGTPTARSARSGHVLEIHAHVADAVLQLEWWYDIRSFEPYTVHELAEQLPHAMIELTSDAAPAILTTAKLAAAY